MADPCPLRKQLSVSALDVLAGERDVVELVPVAIRSCEELGAIGIPVQFEQLFRSSTAKLCPFTLCFRKHADGGRPAFQERPGRTRSNGPCLAPESRRTRVCSA